MSTADFLAPLIIAVPFFTLLGFVFGHLESRRAYRLGVQHERERWERTR